MSLKTKVNNHLKQSNEHLKHFRKIALNTCLSHTLLQVILACHGNLNYKKELSTLRIP